MKDGKHNRLPGVVEYFASLNYITDSITEDFLIDNIWNKSATHIDNAIENGSFLVYNHAHGGVGSTTPIPSHWSQPWYSVWDLNQLYNYNKIPYVYALGCWVGKFDDTLFGDCHHHSEHFIFLTPDTLTGESRGAIGTTSSSFQWSGEASHFLGCLDYLYPAFDPWYPFYSNDTSHQALPGFALVSGFIYDYFRNSNWAHDGEEFEKFHHFGDPYLRLYTELPQNLSVIMPLTLQAGSNTCSISATEKAMIALISNGELIGRKQALPGMTQIEIIPQDFGSEVEVVVTKQNYYRYYDTISVNSQSGTYLRFQEIVEIVGGLDSNQVHPGFMYGMTIQFINFGNQKADSFWVNLDIDDSLITLIDSSFQIIDSVSALDTINLTYLFTVAEDAQDQHKIKFDLDYGYKNSDSLTDSLILYVKKPLIEITEIDGGTPYYPGDTFYFTLEFENNGTGDDYDVEIEIFIDNPFVYAIDTLDTISLIRGGSYNSYDSIFYFRLATDFADSIIPFCLTIKSEYYSDIEVVDTIEYPCGTNFYEYFEEGFPSRLSFTGDSSWCLSSSANHTPGYLNGHALYCGDDNSHIYPNGINNSRAIFSTNTRGKNNFFMTFWQKYEFEEDKDGVQVEYKFSGDTSWNVLETSEGYTGQSQGYGGFNQGDPIYTGDNNIWHEQHFHLSQGDILPESLFISWRFGSNNRGAMEGYYLDDIAVLFHAPIPDEEDNLLGKNSDVLSQTPIEIFGVYPNPVCNRCNIRFLVTNQQSVNLSIFDVTGRSIRTVVDAELMPGTYIAEWDCRDSENYLIPSGTYYYILKNGNNLECDKIIVIR